MKLTNRLVQQGVLLALGSVIATGALALTIQPPSIEVTAEGGTPILTSGTVNGSGCNGDMGCESSTGFASYSGGTAASSSGSGTTTGSNPANAAASGIVTYFYEVVGPANVSVPLLFTASGSTSASGTEAIGQVQAFSGGGAFYACSGTGPSLASCLVSGSYLPTSFSGTIPFSVTTNTLADIELISTGSSTLGTGSFSAMGSVQIGFAPGFTTPGYTLELTGESISSVPIPATFALLLSGIGLMGIIALRRKREPFAAAAL